MTPRQIVAELDKHIVGQAAAKKAVAIAIRNRWRRQQLPASMRRDITPKNIIMIGPTGVGKTEIARRLAHLIGAPFIKVEATRYTEVGYHGRDVESMVRDLAEAAAVIVRRRERADVEVKAAEKVTDRLLDLLMPSPKGPWQPEEPDELEKARRNREKMRQKLFAGDFESKMVDIPVERKGPPSMFSGNPMGGAGGENMDNELQQLLEKLTPGRTVDRRMTVAEARAILLEQEAEGLIDRAVVAEKAVELAENQGIIFIDEIDKVCGPSSGSGPDVSRQGVQRDLLPIVEGSSVSTRQGAVRTDHVLFIAAGAFHLSKPADLMPELQGRFPIRVELLDLTRDDFLRILTEPENALTRQYASLLGTESIEVTFTPDGIDELARIAFEVNRTTQNIGARRLHTILERVVEEVSFDGPDRADKRVVIDRAFVSDRLTPILQKEDLSRYIL